MEKTIIRNEEDLKNYLTTFKHSVFSLDTETTSLSYFKQEVTHLQISNDTQACVIILNPLMINIIQEWFKNIPKNTLIIGHNIVFDAKALYKIGVNIINFKWFDTMVAAHLLDEESQIGLKYLSQKFLGADTIKYTEAVNDKDKFLEYSINDAVWTYQLFGLFAPRLKEEGLEYLMKKIEMPFLRVVFMMETAGWLVDKDRISSITTEIKEEVFSLQKKMYDILGMKSEIQYKLDGSLELKGDLNLNSNDQLAKILFDKLGLEDTGVTTTGKRKTGREAIKKLKGKHVFVDLLEKYKVARKLLTAFFNPMPTFIDPDGRVRSSFNDCGTRTGRLSSRNPNIQQLPKKNEVFPIETRSCFIAPRGKKLIAADYSGQELRVLSQVTMDKGLISAFNSGKDFHQETADKFGVSRTQAKAINFGVAYGKGAYGFSKDWGTTEDEAQKFLDKYFSNFPMVKEAIEQTTKEVKQKGYVTNLVGRRRRFNKVKRDGNEFYTRGMFREAFNFKIQGFSADMTRVAAIKVYNLCLKNKDWGMKILALVHDEVVVEVNEYYAGVAAEAIEKAMVTVAKLKVPLLAEVHIGNKYSEVK